MSKESYQEYLRSDHWKDMKRKSEVIWGHKCIVCSSSKDIHHHHVCYRADVRNAHPSEIIPLCSWCHAGFHENNSTLYGKAETLEGTKRQFKDTISTIISKRGLELNPAATFTRIWDVYLKNYEKDAHPLDTWNPIKRKGKKSPKREPKDKKNTKKQKRREREMARFEAEQRNKKAQRDMFNDYSPEGIERRWEARKEWAERNERRRLPRCILTAHLPKSEDIAALNPTPPKTRETLPQAAKHEDNEVSDKSIAIRIAKDAPPMAGSDYFLV